MFDSKKDSGSVEVKTEYSSKGRKYMALVDSKHPEAWIRVPYLKGSPPDFSDPVTWTYLQKRSNRRRPRNRFQLK